MQRKIYTKPELYTTLIDSEISLVMTTGEGDPPDKPGPSAAQQGGESGPTQQNNFNENPFGE